jgi:hypothetical protein
MAQKVSDLRKLSKDSLINMATKKIDEPSFNVNDFTSIEIWVEDNEMTVEFGYAIRFLPLKEQYYYNVSVELLSGSSSRQIMGHDKNNDNVEFFKPQKYQAQMDFVRNAINNSNGEIGKIPEGQLPDGTMTIQEHEKYFDISVDSESTHSYYKIEKTTGKIYDAGHKHYDMDITDNRRVRIY